MLYNIDYGQEKMTVEMNFTFFHWKVAETLANESSKFSLRDMSPKEVQLLALNIFPGGKTINHYISKRV